jgi:hypothetical protein
VPELKLPAAAISAVPRVAAAEPAAAGKAAGNAAGDVRPVPIKPAAMPTQSEPPASPAPAEDWTWTWQLFVDGYVWTQVSAIRRKDDLEVANDLQQALRGGKSVQRAWLVPHSGQADEQPSVGQQRLLRELQRRSAAGVG